MKARRAAANASDNSAASTATPVGRYHRLRQRCFRFFEAHKPLFPRFVRRIIWRALALAYACYTLLRRLLRMPLVRIPLKPIFIAGEHREQLRWYRLMHRFFLRTLEREEIEAILIPEDIVGYVWPVLVRAGHDRNIPTLVFPYTLANELEPLRSLRDRPEFHTRNNRIAAYLFPSWRMVREGVDLVRLPSPHIFAHVVMGISPPLPWMMNSGFADLVCVESRASFAYFAAGGIPEEMMRVTGSVSQDHLYACRAAKQEALRELRTELGLTGEKPLLLLSGCPNQLAGPTPHCDFSDMEGIAAFVGSCCAPLAEHYHLVVRPHPNYPEFGEMMVKHGFAASMIPTSRLVPISDLFIAFASATIRWAITCAVPTVNYDVFHYGYGDFDAVAGMHSVSSREGFAAILSSMVPGTTTYRTTAKALVAESTRWGEMDGRCLERIEAQFDEACRSMAQLKKETART